ncbi:VOC family protein [Heyndrickxia acidicola]|uniref:VOC family protein n=1 Tax=Heyndrickxia acidicola TaxID=209389 RepID=A0ABU6MLJ1_9BACI|nr:VOC family protein [Heyndrickxia acidicola]MED1204508.1 VOC family protein [Heyndrickxia acidicola]
MNLSFDHLVHFTNNPIVTAETLKQKGFSVSQGGEHAHWGTFNALSYFGLSYLEFLGINHRTIAETAALENNLIEQAVQWLPNREGFGRIALRTNEIDSVAARMKDLGFKIHGPVPGKRTREDGITIQWKMLFIEASNDELPYPFFIQWNQSDEERKQDLAKNQQAHSISNLTFKEVVFAVHDSYKTANRWADCLGLRMSPLEKEKETHKLVLNGGDLIFTSSKNNRVSEYLERHGEGPFLMKFIGDKPLPAAEISGAYFQVNE